MTTHGALQRKLASDLDRHFPELVTEMQGVVYNGARRWLALPGLPGSLQAAEIARFATVLAVSSILARARPDSDRTLVRCFGLLALPAALLAMQPDFGR